MKKLLPFSLLVACSHNTPDDDVPVIPPETPKPRIIRSVFEGMRMEFRVPVKGGYIRMVDYASVNYWNGKHICTWVPKAQ